MEFIKAIILGIIEGITEWLPISSTGHLILADEFIKLKQSTEFMNMFNVVIQLGAILAVVVIYFKKLNPFDASKTPRETQLTWQLWLKVIIACIPAVIIGLPLDNWLDANFHKFVPIALMLIIYGFAFIYVEKWAKTRPDTLTDLDRMSYRFAFYIGLIQVLSLMPGTSRSGVTILGAIILGASRFVATEFTFFLGIPVMFGASLLKIVKFMFSGVGFSFSQFAILMVASVTAFLVSIVVIKFLMDYIKKHDFTFFGKYRIVLGAILLVYAGISAMFG
ncbi:MAG: undecaprenyl-diphosphate phosphatase [Lactococcus raffinolactis]|jgi:undecaprenyl-diphosphatase|uniref:Undecaprenyl-diphosphatase n=1 Tax=Pseudolactococcus raffinolactis TaxID=1366 RepID=A0A2A5S6V4_9LACT|nr:undecaprenyl-diphosphate phosphatase [Lactococcus raffinolactis]MBR2541573.1 undecaprenyl-diphosphate phosphatase [Lactococcus sp.]MDN5584695.1 undecaprenyl-diphosphate phosphatase [Lactobacillus sp.]ATC61021.1 undecaprenyl-diphosphate phosphatase [Lactococcus raffinolactis]MBW9298742.1 undecaprenyl-diphosphate phosphatase [Lactococcus raffinolactis]MBW9331449.1 undecaprenyl-diphosphate phosphatase [Lactococcus raffinolactis]